MVMMLQVTSLSNELEQRMTYHSKPLHTIGLHCNTIPSLLHSCFLSQIGALMGAFLAPILVIIVLNVIIFICVIIVVIRHAREKAARTNIDPSAINQSCVL